MLVKAPLEYVWRPVAEAIDAWITRRKTPGGLGWPLLFCFVVVFYLVGAAVLIWGGAE